MKKLIALAAVLGLAFSSWGSTLEGTPAVETAPSVNVSILPDAQVGAWAGPRLYRVVVRWGGGRLISGDTFNGFVEGALGAAGAAVGAAAGSGMGPVGLIGMAALGGGLGTA